jgi:hypothetical protein
VNSVGPCRLGFPWVAFIWQPVCLWPKLKSLRPRAWKSLPIYSRLALLRNSRRLPVPFDQVLGSFEYSGM